MTINDLLAWLSDDYAKKLDAKRQKEILAKLKRLDLLGPGPESAFRDKRGALNLQGYDGIYTDALPYSMEQQLMERAPRLKNQMQQPSPKVNQYFLEQFWTPRAPPKEPLI